MRKTSIDRSKASTPSLSPFLSLSPVLLVLARVRQALVAGGLHGDDAGGGDEGVGEGGLAWGGRGGERGRAFVLPPPSCLRRRRPSLPLPNPSSPPSDARPHDPAAGRAGGPGRDGGAPARGARRLGGGPGAGGVRLSSVVQPSLSFTLTVVDVGDDGHVLSKEGGEARGTGGGAGQGVSQSGRRRRSPPPLLPLLPTPAAPALHPDTQRAPHRLHAAGGVAGVAEGGKAGRGGRARGLLGGRGLPWRAGAAPPVRPPQTPRPRPHAPGCCTACP